MTAVSAMNAPEPATAEDVRRRRRWIFVTTVALASGIIGLVGLWPAALAAVVVACVAMKSVRCDRRFLGGRQRAIASICLGCLGLTLAAGLALREIARCMRCHANALGACAVIRIYISERGVAPPDGFRSLLDAGACTTQQFLCPSSGKTLNDIASDVYACYVLVPGMAEALANGTAEADMVLLYERDNHDGTCGCVCYVDGHCQFYSPYAEVVRRVEESTRRLEEVRREPPNP